MQGEDHECRTTDEEPKEVDGRPSIRPAKPEDGEAIVDVHVAAIRELGGDAYDDEQVAAWAANTSPDRYPLDEDGVRAIVAERDGSVVGFGWVDVAEAEVIAVYVHPDPARERVGAAILDRLESAAREAGCEGLTLLSSKNAVGFYERRGYEAIETVDYEIRDATLECTRMRRPTDEY